MPLYESTGLLPVSRMKQKGSKGVGVKGSSEELET
jgi:hypothetical protein